MRDQLDSLVQEMLDRGVRYDDARREFEKMFITRALQRSKGSVGDAAELLGLHRNTVARKMTEYRIKSRELTNGDRIESSPACSDAASDRALTVASRSPESGLALSPFDCLTSPATASYRISSRSG